MAKGINIPNTTESFYWAVEDYQTELKKLGIDKSKSTIVQEATIIGIRELKKKIK